MTRRRKDPLRELDRRGARDVEPTGAGTASQRSTWRGPRCKLALAVAEGATYQGAGGDRWA